MNSSVAHDSASTGQLLPVLNKHALPLLPGSLAKSSNFFTISYTYASNHHWRWHWHYIAYLVLVWQIFEIVWMYWWKAPSKVRIVAYPTLLGRWVFALHMIFDSERLLQEAYDNAKGKPYAIPMLDRWIVFVADQQQLKQLENEPETVLSMEEALHELAYTKTILGHLQVPPELKGHRSEAFRIMVGVLKNKLRSNITQMSDAFRVRIKDATALEVNTSRTNTVQHGNEWQKVKLMPALLRIFTRVNLLVFVGEEQADRKEVYDDVMGFFWSCAKAFAILNLAPAFILPYIGDLAMGFGASRDKVYRLLLWLSNQSYEPKEENYAKHGFGHITLWTAEMTKLQDTVRVAKVTLGLLFASAFQVPVIAQFVIYRLCKHPEYHPQLIAEAQEYKDTKFGTTNEEMPYLDSFLKEVSRMTPGVTFSAPRRVMTAYTSPDGYHVPVGNWLAIPQVSLMQDDSIWPDASTFDGFRFVAGDGTSTARYTHPSYDFPFWGSIRHACPARFYVAVVMKMIMSHLLTEYEFKLEHEDCRPFFTFGKTRLPNPFMSILIRKREGSQA